MILKNHTFEFVSIFKKMGDFLRINPVKYIFYPKSLDIGFSVCYHLFRTTNVMKNLLEVTHNVHFYA